MNYNTGNERTSIYFHHHNSGHSINAQYQECEIRGGRAYLQVALRPADIRQTQDEEYSLSHPITYIGIDDREIIDDVVARLTHPRIWHSGLRLEILSRGKVLSLDVTIHRLAIDRLRLLPVAGRTFSRQWGWRRWLPFNRG